MASNLVGLAFIPYYKHLMDILDTSEELKKTSKGMLEQMAWAACGTALGGVVDGPRGALTGGIAGSLYGYWRSEEYSSMVTVLKNLTNAEKQNLVIKVQKLVGSSSLEALKEFISSPVQWERLIKCLREFTNNKSGV